VEFTHILLQSIYENVSKMPYGLRWVCRTLSDLIRKREPDSTELDRNIMLGTVYEVVAAFYLQCRRKRPHYHHSNLMRKRRDYSVYPEDIPRDEVRSSTCF